MSARPQFLPTSQVTPDMLAAAVQRLPFPRGVQLALDAGALRFALSKGKHARRLWGSKSPRSGAPFQMALTDSSGLVSALVDLPGLPRPAPHLDPFKIIGDARWPVGLADAPPAATLILVRGVDDAFAARELWESKDAAVIAMLGDCAISPAALERMRGRSVITLDSGGDEDAFVFGGWREQLTGVAKALSSTHPADVPRVRMLGPRRSLSDGLRFLTTAPEGGKFDLQTLISLIQIPCPTQP